mgnify:CR=1 FL=1
MLGFELTVALRFLREGRMQTALIVGGAAVDVAVIYFITAVLVGVQTLLPPNDVSCLSPVPSW